MASVLPQLMSQLSMSSPDFLPRFASVPWWTEVTAELYTQNEMECNEMEKRNLVYPHLKNTQIHWLWYSLLCKWSTMLYVVIWWNVYFLFWSTQESRLTLGEHVRDSQRTWYDMIWYDMICFILFCSRFQQTGWKRDRAGEISSSQGGLMAQQGTFRQLRFTSVILDCLRSGGERISRAQTEGQCHTRLLSLNMAALIITNLTPGAHG